MSVVRPEVDFSIIQEAMRSLGSNPKWNKGGPVDLGIFLTENGKPFQAIIDVLSYQARAIDLPTQPLVLKWNRQRVLGIKPISFDTRGKAVGEGFKAIAYKADIAELPGEVVRPLVQHLVQHLDRARMRRI